MASQRNFKLRNYKNLLDVIRDFLFEFGVFW